MAYCTKTSHSAVQLLNLKRKTTLCRPKREQGNVQPREVFVCILPSASIWPPTGKGLPEVAHASVTEKGTNKRCITSSVMHGSYQSYKWFMFNNWLLASRYALTRTFVLLRFQSTNHSYTISIFNARGIYARSSIVSQWVSTAPKVRGAEPAEGLVRPSTSRPS